jgi:hypothetical protein
VTTSGLWFLSPTVAQFKRLIRRSGYPALHIVLTVLWHTLRLKFLHIAATTTGITAPKLLLADFLQVVATYSAICAAVELTRLPGAGGWGWGKAVARLFRRRRNEVQQQQQQHEDIELAPTFAWTTAISAPGCEHYRAWVDVGDAEAPELPSEDGVWIHNTWEVVSEPPEVVAARDREREERERREREEREAEM